MNSCAEMIFSHFCYSAHVPQLWFSQIRKMSCDAYLYYISCEGRELNNKHFSDSFVLFITQTIIERRISFLYKEVKTD